MFKIGDIVVVQNKGRCEIKNISKNPFDGCDKFKEYYTMSPVQTSNCMVIYLPTDTVTKVRKLISKNKAENIIKNISSNEMISHSSDESFENFSKIFQNGELEDWVKLLKTLLKRQNKLQKKNVNFQEQKLINALFLNVSNELSFVLSRDKNEIEQLLKTELD